MEMRNRNKLNPGYPLGKNISFIWKGTAIDMSNYHLPEAIEFLKQYPTSDFDTKAMNVITNEGDLIYEVHVDEVEHMQTIANKKYKLGGTTSYLRDQSLKPIIIIGQDECIFQQYSAVLSK